MSYTDARRLLKEQSRKRKEYIRKLAELHPDWNQEKIRKEVERVFGECTPMEVSRTLRN